MQTRTCEWLCTSHLYSYPHPKTSKSQDIETDTFFATTTLSLTGLPPGTVQADISPVLQWFGKAKRISMQPNRRCVDVVFAYTHGVKRTLHVNIEKPLDMCGGRSSRFRSTRKRTTGWGDDEEPGADTNAALQAARNEQVRMAEGFSCPTFTLRRRKRNCWGHWNCSGSTSDLQHVCLCYSLKWLGF